MLYRFSRQGGFLPFDERGIRTVVNGIGGDEMVALTLDELSRPLSAWTPPLRPGSACAPLKPVGRHRHGHRVHARARRDALMAMTCVAPPLLRAGMWPEHPLVDPRLIRFGEWLPYEW